MFEKPKNVKWHFCISKVEQWEPFEEGCRLDRCTKPRDKACIKRCKEAWQKVKTAREARNPGTSARRSPGSGKPSPPTAVTEQPKPKTERQRKVWGAANLGLVNGVLMAFCKKCGGCSNHSTPHHAR